MATIAAALGPQFAITEILSQNGQDAAVVVHRIGEPRKRYVAQIYGGEVLDFAAVEDLQCRDCHSLNTGASFSGRCLTCHEYAAGPVPYEPEQEEDSLALEHTLERSGFQFLD